MRRTRGMVVIAGALSACVADAAPEEEVTVPSMERRLEPVSLNEQWSVGGPPDDERLLMPVALAAGSGRVYVMDPGGMRVAAFDGESGELLWAAGRRGGGPEEFGGLSALTVLSDGTLMVADPQNGRLSFLDPGGRFVDRMAQGEVSYVSSACELADGSLLMATLQPERPVVRLSREGRVLDRYALPWPGAAEQPPIATQAQLVGDGGGRCVLYLALAKGFVPFKGDGFGDPVSYVEILDFPPSEVQTSGEFDRRQRLTERQIAAYGAFYSGGELCFLFEGKTENARRLIDCYDRETGDYRRSLLLPEALHWAAADGERLYFLGQRQSYPVLLRAELVSGTPAP